MYTRVLGQVFTVLVLGALSGCGGGDDGGGTPALAPCAPNTKSTALVGMGKGKDPCPQDNPACVMMGGKAIATCGPNGAWAQCVCETTPAPAVCGNNKKEGAEQCDGTDLGGMTCQAMGKTGVLTCANCVLNSASCMGGMTGGTGG